MMLSWSTWLEQLVPGAAVEVKVTDGQAVQYLPATLQSIERDTVQVELHRDAGDATRPWETVQKRDLRPVPADAPCPPECCGKSLDALQGDAWVRVQGISDAADLARVVVESDLSIVDLERDKLRPGLEFDWEAALPGWKPRDTDITSAAVREDLDATGATFYHGILKRRQQDPTSEEEWCPLKARKQAARTLMTSTRMAEAAMYSDSLQKARNYPNIQLNFSDRTRLLVKARLGLPPEATFDVPWASKDTNSNLMESAMTPPATQTGSGGSNKRTRSPLPLQGYTSSKRQNSASPAPRNVAAAAASRDHLPLSQGGGILRSSSSGVSAGGEAPSSLQDMDCDEDALLASLVMDLDADEGGPADRSAQEGSIKRHAGSRQLPSLSVPPPPPAAAAAAVAAPAASVREGSQTGAATPGAQTQPSTQFNSLSDLAAGGLSGGHSGGPMGFSQPPRAPSQSKYQQQERSWVAAAAAGGGSSNSMQRGGALGDPIASHPPPLPAAAAEMAAGGGEGAAGLHGISARGPVPGARSGGSSQLQAGSHLPAPSAAAAAAAGGQATSGEAGPAGGAPQWPLHMLAEPGEVLELCLKGPIPLTFSSRLIVRGRLGDGGESQVLLVGALNAARSDAAAAAAEGCCKGVAATTGGSSMSAAAAATVDTPLFALKVTQPWEGVQERHPDKYQDKQVYVVERSNTAQKEFEVLSRFKGSPYIVQCYNVGEVRDRQYGDLPATLMEYCAGGSLADYLDEHMTRYGVGLSASDAKLLMRRACGAVRMLHDQGIGHMDIRARKFLFTKQPRPWKEGGVPPLNVDDLGDLKLAGLGRARVFSPGQVEGGVVHTHSHRPPEHAPRCQHDFRLDSWLLGCVLLEMRTGQRPFQHLEGRADEEERRGAAELDNPEGPYHQLLQPPEKALLKDCLAVVEGRLTVHMMLEKHLSYFM